MLFATLIQWLSLSIMAGGGEDEEGLSYKTPLLCTLAGFIILIVIVAIDGLFIHDGTWSLTIGLAIMAVLMLVGIGLCLKNNAQIIGLVGGILFTIFVIIWSVGIVVMATLLQMGLFTYFGDMLLFVIAMGIAMGLLSAFPVVINTFVRNGVLYKVYSS